MRSVRIYLFCAACLAAGWLNPALAAEGRKPAISTPTPVAGEIQFEGPKAGCPPEPAKDECPSTFGPIVTDTAIPIDKGMFALQPTFGLGFVTKSLTQNWRRVSAGGNFTSFGMDYKFTYGLWNNLEVFVDVPFIQNWAGSVNEPGPKGERSASFGGIGDLNLTFKRYVESPVRLTIEADYVTRIEGESLDAELMREYFAAWGDREAYAVSHVGWGMNPRARWDALVMYDRRDVNGTEQRAFAGNFLYSTGANEVAGRYTLGHFDLPFRHCTLNLDGRTIVADGQLQNELA